MSKIPKIAVSFLLILSLILNPFASALDIRARAINPIVIEGVKFVITELIKIIGGSIVVYLGSEAVEEGAEYAEHELDLQKKAASYNASAVKALEESVGVELSTKGENIGCFQAYKVEGAELTAEEQEFADFFINYVNSHPDEFTVGFANVAGQYELTMTPEQYEAIKNEVSLAYNEWVLNKLSYEDKLGNTQILADILGTPTYDFGFVGPIPTLTFPTSTGMVSLMKDGFVHTIPYSSDSLVNGRFATAEAAESYAIGLDGVIVNGSDTQGYYFTASYTGYGGGRYILYNGVVYYARSYSYTSSAVGRSCVSILATVPEFINFVDVNGNTLASVYTGGSYAQGIYYNKTGEVALDRPQVTTIDDSEFTTTTGGGTVEIPRTEEEEVISQAMELGLINPDSTLEFNEDGTIAGADGMTIAKLQELIDMIASGNLQFENIQEYLDLITKLIASGNYTATEQKVILDNIEALNQASAKSLEEINAAVLAISQALTLEGELEDVDTEFSYLDVEHTGLVEAETIVNTALPIVGQAKQLVTNVFNSVDESSEVPNFNFYWDSNKDGVVEKYNFFDLSFMEQPLTNANLEDKSRFTDVMTVREFIQYIIIFVVYAGYLIKLLRRIPGLLGGSEGMADDVNTFNSNRG